MTVFSRPAAPDDAILGAAPEIVYEPSSVGEAAEVMLETHRTGKRIAFVGGATDLELGAPPERLDALLRTGRLARLVEHAPSDQIVVVEAGQTLADLQATLATHRQRLSIDPPRPERATIGGIVAANAFGPRRARFGSIRDLIIGASLVRADGTPARGGSKVVKNVAGFDLPKLMVGSLGTLGLITTVTLRLHPLPEDDATMLLSARKAGDVRALVGAMKRSQLEPVAVVAIGRESDRFDVAVRLEGFRAGVAEQRERLFALARADFPGSCEILDTSAARSLWDRHDGLRAGRSFSARLNARPTDIEPIVQRVLPALLASFELPGFLWYATLGLGFFSGAPLDADSAARAISDGRGLIEAMGGSLTLQSASREIRRKVDVWGTPPPALKLMKSVKARLDPDRRLAPGRFVGGI